MSRIISYPYDDSIKAKDAWVGTDEASRQTKQYTAEALAEYLNISGSISIIGQMTYKYGTTPLSGIGTLAIFGGGPDIVAFSAVAKLTLSNQDISNQRVVEFLDLLVGSDILIAEQGAISTFGYYSIDSYAINATDSNYYDLGVTFKSGNGSMRSDRIYEAQNFVLANDATQSPWNTVPNGISYTAANVGIGTTSPTSELHIATASPEIKIEDTSNSSAKVTLDGTRLAQITQAGTKFTISDEVFGESFFEYDAGSSMNIKIGDTNFANETHIEIDDNTARVLIPNGNVGIGTTSPVSKLEVQDGTLTVDNGNINVLSGGISVTRNSANNTGLIVNQQGTADILNLLDNGVEVLTVTDGGNVGIGTTSPSSRLEVKGGATLSAIGFSGPTVKVGDYTGIGSTRIFSEGTNIGYSTANGYHDFTNAGASQVRITSAGNVGIGTTAPAYKLTSYSNTDFPIVAGRASNVGDFTGIGLSGYIATNAAVKAGLVFEREFSWGIGKMHFLNNNTLGDSDATLLDSKMTIDSTGNVGIGTTSPSATLDVAGNIKTSGALTGPALFEIIAQYANRGRITLSASTSTNANQISLLTSGVPRMVVNKEGKVGIGTTSPGAKLHINDGTNVNLKVGNVGGELQIKTTNDADTAYTPMTLRASEYNILNGNVGIGTTSPSKKLDIAGDVKLTNGNSIYWRNAANNADIPLLNLSSNNTFNIGTTSSSVPVQMALHTAGSERMRITSSGNVGIGTTSPVAKLDVKSSSSNSIPFQVTNSSDTDAIFSILEDGGGDGRARIFNAAGTLSVNLDSSGNSYLNGGNVGIGTTSPTQDLTLYRSSGDTNFLISSNNGASQIFFGDTESDNIGKIDYDHSDNSLNFVVNAAERMRITSAGNVGIGTTSPQANLDVTSTANQQHLNIQGAYAEGVGALAIIKTTANGNALIVESATNSDSREIFEIKNTSGPVFQVKGNGNVGIGTTSPGQKLHVAGGIARFSNVASNYIEIDGSASGSNHGIISARLNQLQLKTNAGFGDPHISILPDTGGNVGIGTASPSEKLEVAGNVKLNSGALIISGTPAGQGAQTRYISGAATTNDLWFNVPTAGRYRFAVADSQIVEITSAGNVGIGTTSPGSKLQVEGAVKINQSADWNGLSIFGFDNQSTDYIKIHIGTTPMARYQSNLTHSFYVGNSRTLDISATNVGFKVNSSHPDDLVSIFGTNKDSYLGYSNADDKFKIGFGSTSSPTVDINTQLSLDGTGVYVENNLGIGTTSPSQKLEVDGQVLSDGYRLAAMQTAPATRNSTGTLGEIVIDGNHIYVCYATDSWSRVALETSW